MGRKANWPPKVIPHKASGRDRVQYQGRTHYLGPIGSAESRAAYVALIGRLQAGRDGPPGGDTPAAPGVEPRPGEGTVSQLAALWAVHASKEYGPEEQASYRLALRPVVRLCGGERVEAFDARALRRVQQQLAERHCRNQVNRRVVRIRTVWRWAELERLAAPGSWAALRAVPPLSRPRPGVRESPKVQPVEWWRAARTAFLGAAPGLRLLILLGWWTGARPGELARLTAGMIDPSNWTARLEHHKNAWRGQERVLYFGPEAAALLAPALDRRGPDDPVCPDGRGGHFKRRSLYQAVRRACERAGVERWHAYRLRHSAKRRFVRLVGLDAARALLGQKSLSSTEQYAAGIDASAAADAARKAA